MARILVVEDEKDLQEVLAYNLRQAGHVPIVVGSGREGLTAVSENRPDLLLLDLMLPDVSGIEICRRLKSEALTRDLPIIMVTAKGDEVDRVVGSLFRRRQISIPVTSGNIRSSSIRSGRCSATALNPSRPEPTTIATWPARRRL